MMKTWIHNPFATACRTLPSCNVGDIPPAVGEAREKLGLGEAIADVQRPAVNRRDTSPRAVDGGLNHFALSDARLVLHSGERLVRARKDAPWVPCQSRDRLARGSLPLAADCG